MNAFLQAMGRARIAAHLAIGAPILLAPGARAWAARHRPPRTLLGRIVLGAAAGFVLVCAHCLLTWHGTASWT